jgi:hypothetical protein
MVRKNYPAKDGISVELEVSHSNILKLFPPYKDAFSSHDQALKLSM